MNLVDCTAASNPNMTTSSTKQHKNAVAGETSIQQRNLKANQSAKLRAISMKKLHGQPTLAKNGSRATSAAVILKDNKDNNSTKHEKVEQNQVSNFKE